MKKLFKFLSVAVLTASLVSCGGGSKDNDEEVSVSKNPLEALVAAGEAMEKGAKEGNKKMEERRAKGDTLAMPYADLQKYLPKIDGYTLDGELGGANVNMGGVSYSNAEAKFKKGENWVKVSIVDYNQAFAMYSAATAMWAMGMSVDTPTEKAGGIKIGDDIGGWEVYQKKDKNAAVTLGVGSRFWVSVEADAQENTEFVKSVAKSIDLTKLSAM